MRIIFSYDIEQDAQNYIIASKSINNKQPTSMQAAYIKEYGGIFNIEKLISFIEKYITNNQLDMAKEVLSIEKAWEKIENEFLKRIKELFGMDYPKTIIHAYLTTDTRCSYNIDHDLFFVSIVKQQHNKTIMHELMHFWTWHRFQEEVRNGNLTELQYNNVKEAFTELLNIIFLDLLDSKDMGYPQHKKIRQAVRETWERTHDIKQTFDVAATVAKSTN